MDKNTSETLRAFPNGGESIKTKMVCLLSEFVSVWMKSFGPGFCRLHFSRNTGVYFYFLTSWQHVVKRLLVCEIDNILKSVGKSYLVFIQKRGSDVEPSQIQCIILANRFSWFFNMLVRLGLGKM